MVAHNYFFIFVFKISRLRMEIEVALHVLPPGIAGMLPWLVILQQMDDPAGESVGIAFRRHIIAPFRG